LAILARKATKFFPDTEKFGLVSQLRRAGISIAANILKELPVKPLETRHILAQ